MLDGYSNDGTEIVLHHLSCLSPRFRFKQAKWPDQSRGGSAIAAFTNLALDMVRESADYLIYVQADEIFHRTSRERMREYEGPPLRINRFVLFWNSFYKVIKLGSDVTPGNGTPWKAVRVFPSSSEPTSTGDGLSFEFGIGTNFQDSDDVVFHYGWNFPVNILQKHISHGRLYPDLAIYRKRASLCSELLLRGQVSTEMLDDLDPQYRDKQVPFSGEHPDCVQHLIGLNTYDPYVGLSLLERGVKW